MKYWRGYLTAAVFAAITWALTQLGQKYGLLVDMIYTYVTRSVQGFLTIWTSGVDFNVWQLVVIVAAVVAVAALVLVIIFKRSVIQWLGWVLAVCSMVVCLNTGIYGLNYYAGPIEEDLRLDMTDYTKTELEEATVFYRDKANALASEMPRDEKGNAAFSDFETLAAETGNGFHHLVLDHYFSIYGGEYTPVKQLGWADMYTSMGIKGVTCFLTGEAAVNPQIPAQGMPFQMAHEMAKRLCVAQEDAANFSAFLACEASEHPEYQYSGYFMAYCYCYEALLSVDPQAAKQVADGCTNEFKWDLDSYDRFYTEHQEKKATEVSRKVNDAYLKVSGISGNVSYSAVCDYLVNWYIIEYTAPEEEPVEITFDPHDETQVDLSGIANAKTTSEE